MIGIAPIGSPIDHDTAFNARATKTVILVLLSIKLFLHLLYQMPEKTKRPKALLLLLIHLHELICCCSFKAILSKITLSTIYLRPVTLTVSFFSKEFLYEHEYFLAKLLPISFHLR